MRRPAPSTTLFRTACLLFACLLATGAPSLAQTRAPAASKAGARPAAVALPADMLGSWGRDETACNDSDSDGRLHVTTKTLDFVGSRYTFGAPKALDGGWWRTDGRRLDEGEKKSVRARVDLRLDHSGALLVRDEGGGVEEYRRCKPERLQG